MRNIIKEKNTIVLGGGCFWCVEAVFKMIKGVVSVEPGYAGGTTKNPTYEQVSRGDTGHAEVIKIDYDPHVITLEDILTVFFATHDPTTKNRQRNDIGEQYRSIILYTTQEQKAESQQLINKLNTLNEQSKKIVTELKKLDMFYPAENYHKNYYAKNQNQPYCQVVINPKIEKVSQSFKSLLNRPVT